VLKVAVVQADPTVMARAENVHPDVRYRVGCWLGEKMPSGLFAVLLLASVGFPLATWLEWFRGGLGEPLGVELVMAVAWLASASLTYAWWYSARHDRAETQKAASSRRGRQ
jgi:hypothetical protein